MMDKNIKKLQYFQGDLLKGIYTFQDAIKDAARECTITPLTNNLKS